MSSKRTPRWLLWTSMTLLVVIESREERERFLACSNQTDDFWRGEASGNNLFASLFLFCSPISQN